MATGIPGSGKGKPSSIWCAERIPDENVGICANIPRISVIDFKNHDYFMYSTDLQNVAEKLGYWDGKEPIRFWKIINGKKPFSIREFYVLSTLAPSLNLSFDAEELPIFRKTSKNNLRDMKLETYEGTHQTGVFAEKRSLPHPTGESG